MNPIKITVSATRAVCVDRPIPLTTGMVGLRAEFTFSSDWDGLTKTAVCVGSGITKDVLDVENEIVVPHECLTDPASDLKIGVYGVNLAGNLVIPTVYAHVGRLFRGADPSGDASADPTLPIWAQLQAMMGDLSNLTTTARDNLVAAINEAAKSGGGGAAADVRMQVAGGYIQYSSDGGKSWNNLIAMKERIGPTDETLTESGQAADAKATGDAIRSLSEEIVTTSESKVAAHNTGTDTHSDIRLLIQGLTDRLNALADSDDTTLDQLSEVVAYIKSNRSLIEAITTSKVSVADIVDNLTTNVANKPLSAAQGVALKALIDAITVPDKLPNPNALTFTGAVTGSYDGSAPLSVEIPSGGGSGGSAELQLLAEGTLTEDAASIDVDGFSAERIAFAVAPYGSTANSENVNGLFTFGFSDDSSININMNLALVTNTASKAWNKHSFCATVNGNVLDILAWRDSGIWNTDIDIKILSNFSGALIKRVLLPKTVKITSLSIGLASTGVIGANTQFKVVYA